MTILRRNDGTGMKNDILRALNGKKQSVYFTFQNNTKLYLELIEQGPCDAQNLKLMLA